MIALALTSANTAGYTKCRRGTLQKTISLVKLQWIATCSCLQVRQKPKLIFSPLFYPFTDAEKRAQTVTQGLASSLFQAALGVSSLYHMHSTFLNHQIRNRNNKWFHIYCTLNCLLGKGEFQCCQNAITSYPWWWGRVVIHFLAMLAAFHMPATGYFNSKLAWVLQLKI
jgi:hypothetical protein